MKDVVRGVAIMKDVVQGYSLFLGSSLSLWDFNCSFQTLYWKPAGLQGLSLFLLLYAVAFGL